MILRSLTFYKCSIRTNRFITRNFFNFFKSKQSKDGNQQANEQPKSESELLWSQAPNPTSLTTFSKSNEGAHLTNTQLQQLKKRQFMEVIELFHARSGKSKRGYNEFAQAAHKNMLKYDVHRDLDAYKAILSVFPKGPLYQTSYIMFDLGQFKRQQETVTTMIMDMSRYRVMPDDEMGQEIIEIFGYRSQAMNTYRRLMYWLPKLKYQDPFPVLDQLPANFDVEPFFLTKLAAQRICVDKLTEFHVIKSEQNEQKRLSELCEPLGMISAQSPEQKVLLSALANHCKKQREHQMIVSIDGPHFFYYKQLQLAYYVLWTETQPWRLDAQFSAIKHEDRTKSDLPLDTFDFPVFAISEKEETRNLPVNDQVYNAHRQISSENESADLLRNVNSQENTNSVVVSLRKENLSQLVRQAAGMTVFGMVEPEKDLDNRWLALTKTHQPSALSESKLLEQHEQIEGTILALGVVTPVPSALEDQRKIEEYESTEKRLQEAMRHSVDLTGCLDKRQVPVAPRPAPISLIRNWINDLRVRNPDLDQATLIFRLGHSSPDQMDADKSKEPIHAHS